MKISTFIQLVLLISAFTLIFGMMAQEGVENYPEANINTTDWYGRYDYSSQINQSVAPVKQSLETIGDENKGWFSKVTAGIAAIPKAVIALVSLTFGSITHGGAIITGGFNTLNIPFALVVVILVMILVWAIFKLVELYNRWQV